MTTKQEFLDGLEFKMGQNVRSLASGIKGMINGVVLYDSGMVQFGVQPASPDGEKLPESFYIDGVVLELLDEGISDRAVPVEETHLCNGMKVRDRVSQLTGYICHEIYSMNGCLMFAVQPPLDKEGRNQKAIGYDGSRLEIVGEPVAEPAPARVRGGSTVRGSLVDRG